MQLITTPTRSLCTEPDSVSGVSVIHAKFTTSNIHIIDQDMDWIPFTDLVSLWSGRDPHRIHDVKYGCCRSRCGLDHGSGSSRSPLGLGAGVFEPDSVYGVDITVLDLVNHHSTQGWCIESQSVSGVDVIQAKSTMSNIDIVVKMQTQSWFWTYDRRPSYRESNYHQDLKLVFSSHKSDLIEVLYTI
ncbi:hypothetical protein BDN72DRAFT_866266, partial [Pluteus cervinus]